jgi:hypothetical protein
MTDLIQEEFECSDHLYERAEVKLLNLYLQYMQYEDLLLLEMDIYKKDDDFMNIQNRK